MVKQSYYLIFIFLSIAADMNADSPCLSKFCEGLPHVPRKLLRPPENVPHLPRKVLRPPESLPHSARKVLNLS